MTYHVHWSGQILDWNDIIGDDKDTLPPNPPPIPGPDQHSHWLDNLVNVNIDFPAERNATLVYDSTTGYWVDGPTVGALLGEAWPTGLIDGGELNIGPGVNDVEVLAGEGIIVDSYTDPDNIPVKTFVSWPQINEPIVAAPPVAGSLVYLLMAASVQQGPIADSVLGILIQQDAPPSQAQVRDNISLGVLIHNGDSWGEISSPIVVNNAAHTLSEFVKQVLGPTYIIDGGAVSEQAGFTLNQEAGTVWEQNRNWHVDKKNPNRESFDARTPMQFQYVNRDFSDVESIVSVVDPTRWDDNGTVTNVGGGASRTTIQRLYIDPRDNIWILWGQKVYASWSEAVALRSEDDTITEVPQILQKSVFLGYIISERSKTDWDDNEAGFFPGGGGGGASSGGGFTPTTFNGALTTGYVPDPITEEFRTLIDDGNWDWRNKYIADYTDGPTYYPQQWVSNSSWIAIANTETIDPAFPIEVGEIQPVYPDDPPFVETSQVAQVRSGYGITFTQSGEVRSLEVWVPEITNDISYALILISDPNGSPQLTRYPLRNDQLTVAQWNAVAVGSELFPAGSEVLVYLESLNRGSSTTVTGGWTFNGQQNTAPPADQGWNHNNAKTIVRIDKNDLDGIDRTSELTGITTGSTLLFAETANPSNQQTYITQAPPTDLGTYLEYAVTLTNETGTLGTGVTTTFTGTVPVAQATKFVFESDKFLNFPDWATITSFLQYDDVDQPVPDTIGYGINFDFQQLSQSPDWDLISIGGGSGGGGGDFVPSTFTGAGTTGYVPDPVTEQGFVLSDDGSWVEQSGGGGATEVEITQAAHGFAVLDCVRWDGISWVKAQANDVDTTALGVVIEVVDTDTFKYAITGRYDVGAHGLTVDDWYFLSAATPGGLDISEPDISQPIVYVEDSITVSVYAYRPTLTGTQIITDQAIKEEIGRISDPVDGVFDFSGLDLSLYDRVYLTGYARSTKASDSDGMRLFFNGDTNDANYYRQTDRGRNGASNTTEQAAAFIAGAAAANSPADTVSNFNITVENPTGPQIKSAVSLGGNPESSFTALTAANIYMTHQSLTDAITALRMQSDSGAILSGQVILYGERKAGVSIAQGPPGEGSSPNTVMNGGFDVWQYGESGSGGGGNGMMADRWYSGSTSIDWEKRNNNAQGNYLKLTSTDGLNFTFHNLIELNAPNQVIEGFNLDQVITISGRMRPNTSLDFTGMQARLQWSDDRTGTNSVVAIAFTEVVPETPWEAGVWKDFTMTAPIAAITVATNICARLSFRVQGASIGDQFDFNNIKMELGANATPYARPYKGDELARCQRYYQVCSRYVHLTAWAPSQGAYRSTPTWFPVTMRVAPTVALGSVNSGSGFSAANIGPEGFNAQQSAASDATNLNGFSGYTVDAEF